MSQRQFVRNFSLGGKAAFPPADARMYSGGRLNDAPTVMRDASRAGPRLANFRALVAAAGGMDKVAEISGRLEMLPNRVIALFDGELPMSDELTTHIEEALQLAPRWLDRDELAAGEPVPNMLAQQPQQLVEVHSKVRRTIERPAPGPAGAVDRAVHGQGAALEAVRNANMQLLGKAKRGIQAEVCRQMAKPDNWFALCRRGKRHFYAEIAREIEGLLNLPTGWLDTPQETVPAHVTQVTAPGTVTVNTVAAAPVPSAPMAAPAAPVTGVRVSEVTAAPGTLPVTGQGDHFRSMAGTQLDLADEEGRRAGPMAIALASTIIDRSIAGKLSEQEAYAMMGKLIMGGN